MVPDSGAEPPWWYLYLKIAQWWDIKPWEIDDTVPLEWVLRQLEALSVEALVRQLKWRA